MNKILLIDGNSLTYRAYYGSAYGPRGLLKTSTGIPVNAILTLNLMLNKAIKKYDPSHILVAFDAGKKTVRHDKLESYKGGRQKTPPELIQQFPLVKVMLDKWGMKHFEISQIEADDIIGTLATKYSNNPDHGVMVMSSDKDLYQLVQPGVNIIVPQNGAKEDKFITEENFYDTMGYNPNQVIDMKGLTGDASDNLPGVAGVGDKGASKLLAKYGTLEGIYEHMEEHTPKLQEKLTKSKDMAFLCKDVATLMLDIEVPYELEDMLFKNEISEELIDFFKEYELNSLVRRFAPMKKIVEKKPDTQMSFDKLLF